MAELLNFLFIFCDWIPLSFMMQLVSRSFKKNQIVFIQTLFQVPYNYFNNKTFRFDREVVFYRQLFSNLHTVASPEFTYWNVFNIIISCSNLSLLTRPTGWIHVICQCRNGKFRLNLCKLGICLFRELFVFIWIRLLF